MIATRSLEKGWLWLSCARSPSSSWRTTISGGDICDEIYMWWKKIKKTSQGRKTKKETEKPITQFSRQLVELTKSSLLLIRIHTTAVIIRMDVTLMQWWHQGTLDGKIPFVALFCVDHNPSYDYGYNTMMISWFHNGQASVGWKIPHFWPFWCAPFPNVMIITQVTMKGNTMVTSGFSNGHAPACGGGWGPQRQRGARGVWARWRTRSVLHGILI